MAVGPRGLATWCVAVLLCLCAGRGLSAQTGPEPAPVTGRYYALIVSGTGSDGQGRGAFTPLATRLCGVLTTDLGYSDDEVTLLAETEGTTAEGVDDLSAREQIAAAAKSLTARMKPEDQLVVVVMGLAVQELGIGTLRLPGPDVTVKDFAALFGDLRGRIVFIITTPWSGSFTAALKGPDRVVIAATSPDDKTDETRFAKCFVEALEAGSRTGDMTIADAYTRTCARVAKLFRTEGVAPTEHATLDDDGDGVGTGLLDKGPDGTLSRATHLGGAGRAGTTAGTTQPADVGARWEAYDPSAVVLLREVEFSFTADLICRQRERTRIKILDKAGQKHSEVVLFYNAAAETLEIEEAKTVKPNGEIVLLDPKMIFDFRATQAGAYSEARCKQFSMPSVDDGVIIDYTCVRTGRNLHLAQEFWKTFQLDGALPQGEVRITVRAPASKEIIAAVSRPKPSLRIEEERAEDQYTRSYRVALRDVPPLPDEPNAPPGAEIATRLIVSSMSSWDSVWTWYKGLIDEARKPTEEIRALVEELTEGISTPEAKARALYDYVASKIRYVGLELGLYGFQPHAAATVLERKFGDCKDKAVLLLTLLDLAGIDGSIVLVPTDAMAPLDPAVPTLDQFNHVMATATINGRRFWLDPTVGDASFGDIPTADQGRQVFVVGPDEGTLMTVPVRPAEENHLRSTTTATLDADGTLHAEDRVEYTGALAAAFRTQYLYVSADRRKQELETAVHNFTPTAEMSDFSIEGMDTLADTIEYCRRYDAREYGTVADDLLMFHAPLQKIGLTNLVASTTRATPLSIGHTMQRGGTVRLSLPKSYRVRNLPAPIRIQSSLGSYREDYAVDAAANVISCSNDFVLKAPRIGPDQYAAFRQFMLDIAKAQRRVTVLIRSEGDSAGGDR